MCKRAYIRGIYFGISKPHWSQFNIMSSTIAYFAGWLADWMSVCVRSVLTGITIKYTQHSDMWQNYKTKLFFSLQHLRWIHNPPKQKSSKTAVCTRRTVYLWIGYDLTVDDHLYASKPKQKTRTIREARLYGTQRHKKNMKWINYTYFKACSHKLTH